MTDSEQAQPSRERDVENVTTAAPAPQWGDRSRPLADRVEMLLQAMTLEEKVAQLGSAWPGGGIATTSPEPGPMDAALEASLSYEDATRHGVGHLTRVVGNQPVDVVVGARCLAERQQALRDGTRLGIPAIAHEECLTGFTAQGATVFPTPLALAASFDTRAVERMAGAIGDAMHSVGVHQGLSPVLDVVRDYRWGRVEETFGEDPYLVGLMGCAYVRGLESSGVIATLKHFAGYSASKAGRNHAPVSMGPRELADVMLPPFEMAVRDGGARSVMNSYSDVDGVPAAADASLLTDVLREQWGFEGVVVSDYWAVIFLEMMHHVAASPAEAGVLALRAGIDIELPDAACFGAALVGLVREGGAPEWLVDRAARRVLRQKGELGLLDADWSKETRASVEGRLDLDPPANRALARELAENSIVLLANDDALPLGGHARSVAVIGPCADDPLAFCGCYSFPNHIIARKHPELPLGVEVPTLIDALRAELPAVELTHEVGCPIQRADRSGFAAAVEAARAADVCLAVLGDRPGLFGTGTSGEGCDAEDLRLPGVQGELLDELLEAGTRVILITVSGRPYALGRFADRLAAALQAFIPGEEGGPALAGVLSGRVVPSGKLPVQIPRSEGAHPGTYLHPFLGAHSSLSSIDPAPLFAFGHGLSYTTFDYSDLRVSAEKIPTDGELEIGCTITNSGTRSGAEVVQLYVADPVAQVARPILQLAGFARTVLEPGASARVHFRLHADRVAFTGVDLHRIVEPGNINVMLGGSSDDLRLRGEFRLVGEPRLVDRGRVLTTPVEVLPAA